MIHKETKTMQGEGLSLEQQHEKIMSDISTICHYPRSEQAINGVHQWYDNKVLSEDYLLSIVQRGVHTEIMHVLERYSALRPAFGNYPCYARTVDPGMPGAVKDAIVERNNYEEIMLLLNLGPIPLISQRKWIDSNNQLFLPEYRRRYGFCFEIEKEWIDNGRFRELAEPHELTLEGQRYMLSLITKDDFYWYINKYGLWEYAHVELLQHRPMDEIMYYINCHRFLGTDAKKLLLKKDEAHDAIMLYIKVSTDGFYFVNKDLEERNNYIEILFNHRRNKDFRKVAEFEKKLLDSNVEADIKFL